MSASEFAGPGRQFVLLSPYPPAPTGPAEYCSVFSRQMAQRGHRVTVVTEALPEGAAPDPTPPDGVRVVRAFRRGIGQGRAIERAVRAAPGDVVVVHYSFTMYGGFVSGGLTLAALRRIARRRPVVVMMFDVLPKADLTRETLRLYSIHLPAVAARFIASRVVRAIERFSSAILVQTESAARVLVEEHGVPARKVHVIDLPAYPPPSWAPARAPVPRRDGRKTVLFYGYLAPYKGVEVLLDAYASARQAPSGRSLRLVIAGTNHSRIDYDYRGQLVERARSLGFSEEEVSFPGYVEDGGMAPLFGASDLVVLPYLKTTGASGALATAIGLRRPVLISALPPIVGQMNGYPGGRTVPPGEVGPLAEALEDLALDRYARAPPPTLTLHPSWEDLVGRTRSIFAEVARPGRTPRSPPARARAIGPHGLS